MEQVPMHSNNADYIVFEIVDSYGGMRLGGYDTIIHIIYPTLKRHIQFIDLCNWLKLEELGQ